MARLYEGKLVIPLEDFWKWVEENYLIENKDITVMGIPKINSMEKMIEIDFASSSEGSPTDWTRKPEAVRQWERVEKEKNPSKKPVQKKVV